MILKILDREGKEISKDLLGTKGYKYKMRITYKCDSCGDVKETCYDSIKRGRGNRLETQFCNRCTQLDKDIIKKKEDTCLEKFGVTNYAELMKIENPLSKNKEYNRIKTNEYRLRHEVVRSILKYKGIEGIDYVECKICGKRGLYIDSRHLKTRHNISKEKYIKMFPNAEIISEKKRCIIRSIPKSRGFLGKSPTLEHRLRLAESKLGNKNPAWRGGISFEPYCRIFKDGEFKDYIKCRDKNRCQNPSCSNKYNRLAIHHIDYDKKNCVVENLITLCVSCNTKANHNRSSWQKFYTRIVEMKYVL